MVCARLMHKRIPAKTVIKAIIIIITIIIIVDQGLVLNKQKFRDSLRLRYKICPRPTYQASVFVVRSIPSAMPCLARREGLWRRDTVVFATYLPHLLIRFAPTLKSNHNYNLSVMSDLTSEER